jgi:antitoxin HicB
MAQIDELIAAIKRRPYLRELLPEDDGTWFARIVEFPGCMTEGENPADAVAMLDDAMTAWLHVKIEDGDPIPEPLAVQKYSGKTMVRLGGSLHRDAVVCAERDGVSLNLFITTAVARACASAVAKCEVGEFGKTVKERVTK